MMRTGARVGTNSSNRIAAVVADSAVVRVEAARGEVVVAEVGRRANAEAYFECSPPTLLKQEGVGRPEAPSCEVSGYVGLSAWRKRRRAAAL